MDSSKHQLPRAQVEEKYPCTDNSGLVTGYQSGEVPQEYTNLKLYLGGEKCTVTREITLEAFSHADYAADDKTRKRISGTAFLLNRMSIRWSCKRQQSVSLSTMEVEFVEASKTSQEVLATRELFTELKIRLKEPMILWIYK
uniref:AlNc14C432G11592 protein n=1 Tax=Albugo laibachii Nc14 TaxID=890382 RepID=F0WZK1_9STRA|nr:AlNc14C432G11592 [Albugo laibachii Nc14]|eukprot:CCA26925.1 AlNc14C432G11592 [Albugo laibachii Nc14]